MGAQGHDEAVRDARLAGLGRAVAGLAHELRNHFAVMQNSIYLLRRHAGGLDEAGARQVERLHAQVEASFTLAEDVLALGRAGEARAEVVPIAEVVGRAASETVPAGSAARLAVVAPDPHLRARVDPDKVARAVTNLVRNAVEALGPAGGDVEVSVAAEGSDLVLRVADSGPGLPPGAAESLFEPFVSTREGGTGLGLALVRLYAEAHGGSASAGDRPGGGAVFTVRLPGAVEG